MMKNKRLFPLAFTAVCCLGISSAFSAPYTGWMNDYTGSEANTLLLWKFDNTGTEENPSYGADSSGNGHYARFATGTGGGDTQTDIGSAAGLTATGVTGKFGTGFQSGPGSSTDHNAYVRNTNAAVFNGAAISVEFWFNPEFDGVGTQNWVWLFDKWRANANPGSNADNSGIALRISQAGTGNEGRLEFLVGNGTSTSNAFTESLEWEADTWYHIAVTFENINNDGHLKIFRDGQLLGDNTVVDFGDAAAGSYTWRLGNRITSSYGSAPGIYDNFRISSVSYEYAIPEPGTLTLFLLAPLFGFFNKRKHYEK